VVVNTCVVFSASSFYRIRLEVDMEEWR